LCARKKPRLGCLGLLLDGLLFGLEAWKAQDENRGDRRLGRRRLETGTLGRKDENRGDRRLGRGRLETGTLERGRRDDAANLQPFTNLQGDRERQALKSPAGTRETKRALELRDWDAEIRSPKSVGQPSALVARAVANHNVIFQVTQLESVLTLYRQSAWY
jgi:hypothetical protein